MIDRGYLIQPDFEVRSKINFIGGMPDLKQFDKIFISCSGGKDSQAMAFVISELAEKQAYNKENIELVYADTGLEWHDTFDHVKKIGRVCGIKAVMVKPKYKLLDNVRRRWDKFNGRTEQNRTEQNSHHFLPETERRNNGKSIPESRPEILQQRSQADTNRAVCPFPSQHTMYCRSWGKIFPINTYIRESQTDRQTIPLLARKILYDMGEARANS